MSKHILARKCVLVALAFGFIDDYYQSGLVSLHLSGLLYYFLAWGPWLIPLFLIVVWQTNAGARPLKCMIWGILTWLLAILSYYFSIFLRILVWPSSGQANLHLSHWQDKNYLRHLGEYLYILFITDGVEWYRLAILGGGILSLCLSLFISWLNQSRNPKNLC
ncbi:hypothetical protein [Vaginisenegalia massiliensis]|uniref:hypothetical protein n=1 Tax=Vaginisenegalia massiliensis TaxID=2058294 RepID=UPI000F52D6F8|nr:hypothetical protein [Vaginisenegalia massiliensis]